MKIEEIHDFEKAAQQEKIIRQLETDPAFRQAFETQRSMQQLMALKKYERMTPESRTRIRAGVLREIRSPDPASTPVSPWQILWRWSPVWGTALVLLAFAPFFLSSGPSLTPVTEFSMDEPSSLETSEGQAGLAASQAASNELPASLQSRPVQAVPVRYDLD